MNENPKAPTGPERRAYIRINKSFILTYYDKANRQQKFEITQLKNISMGGMCFITSKPVPSQTELHIDLKTPYIAEITYLDGIVLGSQEKIKGLIYETRVQFKDLKPESEFILHKLIKFSVKEGNNDE